MIQLLRMSLLALFAVVPAAAQAQAPPVTPLESIPVERPRIIVLTDITNEPDDQQSLVRFLVYTNEFDVEGLIATTSTWLRGRVSPERILELIAGYEQVQPNLLLHAPGFPTGEQLRSVVHAHLPEFGMQGVGEGKSSPGSRHIIEVVDRPDDRPVWISVWGGPNALAQALWEVRSTRSARETAAFVSRLRVYAIADQDESARWIRSEFPEMLYIVSPSGSTANEYYRAAWTGISGDRFYRNGPMHRFELVDNPWLLANVIEGHGPLGALYPLTEYIMEGDTPSFLGLIPNGLGSALSPAYGGWGGRYQHYAFVGERRAIWTDGSESRDSVVAEDGTTHISHQATIWRWREAYQHDLAARIDWTVLPYEAANHNPEVVVNGVPGAAVLAATMRPGETILLDAAGTSDPDGDELTYRWWIYPEAGSYGGAIRMDGDSTPEVRIPAPDVDGPADIHVILEVRDDGEPALYRYRRIILSVQPE